MAKKLNGEEQNPTGFITKNMFPNVPQYGLRDLRDRGDNKNNCDAHIMYVKNGISSVAQLSLHIHQENPESTSMNLEALGKYKIVWSPTVSFKVLGSASVIDSQCEVLGV